MPEILFDDVHLFGSEPVDAQQTKLREVRVWVDEDGNSHALLRLRKGRQVRLVAGVHGTPGNAVRTALGKAVVGDNIE